MMSSDEYSFGLDEVPGCFLAFDASPLGIDPANAEFNHSPRVLFGDTLLGDHTAALVGIAFSRLAVGAAEQ